MSIINLAGFGKTAVNGFYNSNGAGTKDGYARYVKTTDSDLIAEYRSQFGPYCFSGSYYILQIVNVGGAVPIQVPLYKNDSTSITGGTWVSLQSISSGSNTTGSIDALSTSSSSSSSSSA